MKSQFLKIAGVKSEKAFYKKYPTEAAFFKAHPEAKKMANGGIQDKGQLKKLEQLTDFGNPPIAQGGFVAPYNPYPQFDPNFQMGQLNTQGLTNLATQQPTPFGSFIAGQGDSRRATANSYGKMFGNFQTGQDLSAGIKSPLGSAGQLKGLDFSGKLDKLAGKAAPYIGAATDIIEGIGMIGGQKEARRVAKQEAKVTDIMAKAANTRPEKIERKYIRPEDVTIQPNQLFPSYGVGTNVLAEDGAVINQIGGNPTEIANTFAPNTIYSDMGYEPLNDTNRVKAFYSGGKLTAQNGLSQSLNTGDFADFMNDGGGEMLNNFAERIGTGGRGPSAGSKIGGGVLGGIGTAFGGPVGGMIGKTIGTVVGGLLDKDAKQTERFQKQSARNMSNIVAQQTGMGLQSQFSNYLEDGGYVSHNWNPQVIAKFGDYDMKDLLAADPTMDTLRTGGNIRSNHMFETDQFAMGGDLKVYRGEAETMSYNPYLPDGGETVMFRGPSHEDGGMPITYGQSPVEVEGGEPAVKLQDGTSGDSSLNVYGNLKITKPFAELIGKPEFRDKKFKNVVADLSKTESKLNKKIDKSVDAIDNLDVVTSFDKMALDTYNANIMGSNMQLKNIAQDKLDLAALQSAINDSADEIGVVADDLAKGRLKVDKSKSGKAKYGTNLPKAATGTDITPAIAQLMDLMKKKGYDYQVTSTVRPGAKTAQGRSSRHSTGEAADIVFPQLGEKAYEAIKNDPEIARFMLENGLTAIDEYDPDTLAATKGTGPHIHFGYDRGTAAADKFRTEAAAIHGNPEDVKYGAVDPKNPTYSKKGVQPGMIDYNPLGTTPEKIFATEESYKTQWLPKVDKAFSDPEKAKEIIAQIENYSGQDAEDVKALMAKQTSLEGKIAVARKLGTDMKVGPYHNILNNVINRLEVPPATEVPPTTTPTTTLPAGVPPPKVPGLPWQGIVNTLLPYVRPSDAEPLSPIQILGELSTMADQEEPVYGQRYTPQLQTPYDISLQDQLNANQADFNALLRATGGDASAASALAAQKYAANSKVLGEQFRLNQAEKDRVYSGNIQTLNDAQLRNLALADQQYVRQAQAKSNTKAAKLAALNSISSKFSQNKLDNRTLATYENLYNYRYNPNFVAQNMNPLAKFNMPTVTTNLPIYDGNGNIVGYQKADGTIPAGATPPYVAPGSRTTKEEKPKAAAARNGSIVKALKNL